MIRTRKTVLIVGDIIALSLSFLGMALIRFNFHSQVPYIALQARFFAFIFILWLVVFFIFELYNPRRVNPNPRNIGLLLASLLVNALLTVVLFYLFPGRGVTPKTNLLLLTSIAFVLLALWRRLFYNLFTKTFPVSIGIVGNSPLLGGLMHELEHNPHLGIVRKTWESLPETSEEVIDVLICESAPPQSLVATARALNTEVLSLVHAYETLLGKVPLELMTDERAVDIITKQKKSARVVYRLGEIVLASLILIIASPFLLVAMLAILIEDGSPVFYSQERIGKNGKVFFIHKLRSMRKNAEANGAQWAQLQDPRITRIGRILRLTHLDEVPQMWNVLKGDLAFIGPRAERPEIVATLEKEIPYYYLRHAQKPGFTGWAQIKFRYARTVLDSREKFEYDLYYLLNKNPLLDFGIVLKTLQIIFTH